MSITTWFLEAARGLAELVLVPHCVACNEMIPPGPAMCHACLETLDRVDPDMCCPTCGDLAGPEPCHRCVGNPPPFEKIDVAWAYSGAIPDAVHRLKFNGGAWVASPLIRAAYPTPRAGWEELDALVPIPLHVQRQRERGYNQARLLAAELGNMLDIPVMEGALQRHKATVAAATLAPAEREEMVRDAFVASRRAKIKGLKVGLVDDVVTTTSTVRSAALALREAGVSNIVVIALARGGHGLDP